MKTISISNDIVPIAEFKTSISKWFKNLQNTGHPLIITQNGKPAGVLLSPNETMNWYIENHFLIPLIEEYRMPILEKLTLLKKLGQNLLLEGTRDNVG